MLSPSISKMLNDDPQNSPSKVTKPVHEQKEERQRERERNTRGPAHNLTHRNATPFWWKNKYMSNILQFFSRFPLPHISFHHFSTLISSISFHFISPCDGASDMVGRHPCYSRTYNIWASSHLIPRPNLVLDTS